MTYAETVAGQISDLAAGKYSSEELTRHYLQRIEALKTLNCYITVTSESALAAARRADSARAAGHSLPLLGVPIAHKDIFCTRNELTTAGSRMLYNFAPPYDAMVVDKLEKAGAVMLGKTNMDEFAMGSSNENSFYGPVRNPWDVTRVPGGSSGGSAAAVAAGLCAAATGTDTGGSIRQPAALCGITGLKPTYGRVSRWGMIAFASSLDQAGPMTQTAMDAALMLGIMAGVDPRDSTSIDSPVPDYVSSLETPVSGMTIGICEDFMAEGLDTASEVRIADAIRVFESLGATIKPIRLPHVRYSVPAYYVIAPAEASANLSRYDGVRFGYRCKDPASLEDLYKRSRSEGIGPEVQRRIMVGAFTLSAGFYDAYYRKAQQVRRLISNDFKSAFDQVDFLVGPTSPQPAFRLGEKSDDQVSMYLQDIYTIGASLAGLPALSMPVGLAAGLPVGLQLIGRHLDEARLLGAAHQFQSRTHWHEARPELEIS
ncbi:MAG: Asp-tRNA(Asn)/Glu-tRNA(Gln) amidotransferase subunit GatA [Proteobacteria bacterium]|jgi:aspartyl-tRNA(Asn)/glutamyl-tRNA(Gln) amidotransferase subunit A|nr:Asp-tRNA(Asn)/Glu-tRNA(Gln) amidotransferase subunit GatA [Pseudomonadota bacterium]